MTDVLIGIDLGATNVRAGAFTPQGELLAAQAAEIEAQRGPQVGLERIARVIEAVLPAIGTDMQTGSNRIAAIGVGSTGPTDSQRGLILNPGTLPGWVNVSIVDFLQQRFGAPACLENDADAAALGEYWMGAGQGVKRLYMITVGTGIGTAVILDGEVYRGAGGFHPEGGHIIVDPSGPACYCGAHGCWESWSSGSGIERAAREAVSRRRVGSHPVGTHQQVRTGRREPVRHAGRTLLALAEGDPQRITARLVAEAARQDDLLAGRVMSAAAERFALGIHTVIMAFHPESIVLSGGVMRSLDLFQPAIDRAVQAAGGYVPLGKFHIGPAKLGYEAGMYGAAYAARKKIGLEV